MKLLTAPVLTYKKHSDNRLPFPSENFQLQFFLPCHFRFLIQFRKIDNIRSEIVVYSKIETLINNFIDIFTTTFQVIMVVEYGRKEKLAVENVQKKTGNDKVVYYHCDFHKLSLILSIASDAYNMVCLVKSLG